MTGLREMGLKSFKSPGFNLALTLGSGQVFHWSPCGDGYLGLIGNSPCYVESKNGRICLEGVERKELEYYFALDHRLDDIYKTFPVDPAMAAALEYCRGVRIIRQPAWECTATFITSALKQVAHIRQMSFLIREKFGEPVFYNGQTFFTYPEPEILAQAAEEELRACKLGFRAKTLLGTARAIAEGKVDLGAIAKMDDEMAVEELCKLPGVGEKVANCILLFGYGRMKAFPIDVWINRVLTEIYFKRKRNVTAKRLKKFSQEYFGDYRGYAQQYLFHHARMTYRKAKS